MKKEVEIAKILRPHGIKGALKVEALLPVSLSKFDLIYVGDDKERMHLKRVQPLGDFFLIQIDEITTCELAEFYRNQYIYVDKDFYPDIFKDMFLPTDYIGCEVFDENSNKIGVIVDIANYGSKDVISINCNGMTYMVPFVEEVIKYDEKNNIFVIDSKHFEEIKI